MSAITTQENIILWEILNEVLKNISEALKLNIPTPLTYKKSLTPIVTTYSSIYKTLRKIGIEDDPYTELSHLQSKVKILSEEIRKKLNYYKLSDPRLSDFTIINPSEADTFLKLRELYGKMNAASKIISVIGEYKHKLDLIRETYNLITAIKLKTLKEKMKVKSDVLGVFKPLIAIIEEIQANDSSRGYLIFANILAIHVESFIDILIPTGLYKYLGSIPEDSPALTSVVQAAVMGALNRCIRIIEKSRDISSFNAILQMLNQKIEALQKYTQFSHYGELAWQRFLNYLIKQKSEKYQNLYYDMYNNAALYVLAVFLDTIYTNSTFRGLFTTAIYS